MTRMALLILLALCTSGCFQKDRLYFGTASSVGVDVSGDIGAPTSVSIAYRRHETVYVPPKEDGTAHSVLGTFDADIDIAQGHQILQIFATGAAANAAASALWRDADQDMVDDVQAADRRAREESTPCGESRGPLLVHTGTLVGIGADAGTSEISPSFNLGYKRREAAIVAVQCDEEVRPVYAYISVDTTRSSGGGGAGDAVKTAKSTLNGVRIKQTIATGSAAVRVAGKLDVAKQIGEAVADASQTNSK